MDGLDVLIAELFAAIIGMCKAILLGILEIFGLENTPAFWEPTNDVLQKGGALVSVVAILGTVIVLCLYIAKRKWEWIALPKRTEYIPLGVLILGIYFYIFGVWAIVIPVLIGGVIIFIVVKTTHPRK